MHAAAALRNLSNWWLTRSCSEMSSGFYSCHARDMRTVFLPTGISVVEPEVLVRTGCLVDWREGTGLCGHFHAMKSGHPNRVGALKWGSIWIGRCPPLKRARLRKSMV